MKGMGFQKISIIRFGYGVILGVFILFAFFPYFSETLTYGPHFYTQYFPGWFELIFGGWVGIGLLVASIILLNSQRIGKSIIFGISGCILILINLILRTIMLGITIEIGFYLSLVLLLGLFAINPLPFVFREREVKVKPSPKVKLEKPKEVAIDWDKREINKNQAIEYIEKMQLKTTELPYFKIISETGIIREDLDPLVKEMISQKKINAKVRDYVILFQEISPEKKQEELNKIKKEIQQKISQSDNLIKINEFSFAIKNLNEVKETARIFGLLDFIKTAEIKIKEIKDIEIERKKEIDLERVKEELQLSMLEIDKQIKDNKFKNAVKSLEKVKKTAIDYNLSEIINKAEELDNKCKVLELEIKANKEKSKIEKKIQKSLSNIEKLIESNKVYEALEELVEIKEIANKNNLVELVKKIEEKIDDCKNFQINTINKIKKTIINYGSKLARLELMDISEKSGILNEKLIEKIILEMITNREIKAEYFSSSKSIAFYQQEKEAASVAKQEEIKKLRVFLSYSTLDTEDFQISNIVKSLEVFPEIKKVSYWEADSKENIVEFMENTLKNTDVFVLFCSPNSVKSDAVKDEWQAAFQMRKKGLLKIIPVYEDEELIPVLLWQMLNVKFLKEDFDSFIQKLYEEILR